MRALGHTTAEFTLGVYAQATDWSEDSAQRLRDLVDGVDLVALHGTKAAEAAIKTPRSSPPGVPIWRYVRDHG
jgi:hypothetical protein